MNLFSKRTVKALLKKYKFSPKKRLGQNFLIDKGVCKEIIRAANLKKGDLILEIGPGIGNLTQELAKRVRPARHRPTPQALAGGKVIAIEKDKKMIEILQETVDDCKNVKIIYGDILKIKLAIYKIQDTRYKVVANLPYYIVSPVIRKFLESSNPPKLMVLMVQKEVAQRICARPPQMNLLAVSVQFYAKPEIISFVSKSSFWPSPKVDSAILKISNIRSAFDQRRGSAFDQRFFRIAKAGFSQPRKQLINNLSKGLKINREKIRAWLLKNKIQPEQRAETLRIQDWIKLTKTFDFY